MKPTNENERESKEDKEERINGIYELYAELFGQDYADEWLKNERNQQNEA